MAYQTYTTDAIVCGSREHGASDKVFWLFTKDAGMVVARAKSVRESRSKLRYGLQDFSLCTISLVRGRQDWRIVGTEPRENIFFMSRSRDARAAVLHVVRILRRLLPGEEPHPHLYLVLEDGLSYLSKQKEIKRGAEQVLVFRLLYHLGYIAPQGPLRPILTAATLDGACGSAAAFGLQRDLERAVAEALSATQL